MSDERVLILLMQIYVLLIILYHLYCIDTVHNPGLGFETNEHTPCIMVDIIYIRHCSSVRI